MADKERDKIKLTKEQRDEMVAEIKSYFLKERDEEIGDLAAGFILDFVLEKLAPAFYNEGVADAYKFMGERVEDMLSIERLTGVGLRGRGGDLQPRA
jgi:uncharacterized protein (DUF2164 family)